MRSSTTSASATSCPARRSWRRLVRTALLAAAALPLMALGSGALHGHTVTAQPAVARADTPAQRHVVAYFPIWARNSGYSEDDVDFGIVTDVAHFAVTPQPDGSIQIPDWGPFPDPALVARTHAAGAHIVLVVGGDDEAARAGFSGLAASAATRQSFVDNLLRLLNANGYDGVDLDWEFPNSATDRDNLTALIGDLHAALGANRTLSMTAGPTDYRGQWLDLTAIMPDLSWLSSMTYDMGGAGWSHYADDNAALHPGRPGEDNVADSVAYYLGRGVPAAKLMIGLPFFGQRYDQAAGVYAPLNAPSNGSSPDYKEIAALVNQGWLEGRNAATQTPYLQRQDGPGVITFDDATSVAAKCAYVVSSGIGGVIVWRLGQDMVGDIQPLLQAARACR
ncbi:MAG TPA: glycoside hydrolase family 18 protein [Dehalococcoidia bacterium]